MLKCFNPEKRWEYENPLAPGTIFHYRALTGPILYDDFQDIMRIAINTCVTKVENIELTWTERKHSDPDDPKSEMIEVEVTKVFTPEDPFITSKHPRIVLTSVIPQSICTPLMWAIWSRTALTKKESGE
jgi:hypothetical protein